jgi:hypothetical protein
MASGRVLPFRVSMDDHQIEVVVDVQDGLQSVGHLQTRRWVQSAQVRRDDVQVAPVIASQPRDVIAQWLVRWTVSQQKSANH